MRLRPLAVAPALVLALLGPPSASGAEPRLTEVGDAPFPHRSYVLTLPEESRIDSGRVVVTENGADVSDLTVRAARADGGDELGVVLVIDASRSMKGEPIRSAMRAARAFAQRRSPSQPLAVVTFNSRPAVLLPFTTDPEQIERALAAPPELGRQTYAYDATAAAIRLLRAAGISAGSVVLLSDGDDTGSQVGVAAVAADAQRSGARVFTVGLESGAFDRSSLQSLAGVAGGRYTSTGSPRRLASIYDALASELAGEYLLSYRSTAPPGREITVFARVRGLPGAATSGYLTPATPADGAAPPFEQSSAQRFWRSPLAMLVVSLIGGIALWLGVAAIGRPTGRELRTRLTGFLSAPEAAAAQPGLVDHLYSGAERSLGRTRWWARFKLELELARIDMPAERIVVLTAVSTVLVMWLLAQVGPLLMPVALVLPVAVRGFIRNRLRQQRRLFEDQLADNLQVVASAMRAGHSLPSSLAVVVGEASEPSKTEFSRIVADEQLGVPLEDAFGAVAVRMDNREIDQVGMVATLQRETGGNTAEVLDRVSDNIRARGELRRLIRTLTAQGRLSRWIITALPPSVLLLVTVLNPGYAEPLYTTTTGNILLAVAAAMVALGSMVIQRIVDIKS